MTKISDQPPVGLPERSNRSMLRRLCIWRRVATRLLGNRLIPLAAVIAFVGFRLATRATMALDYLFYPRLRRARVVEPIVIVGNPRSGTTFLHRFLSRQGVGLGLELWQMIVPSLTLQRCLRPLLGVLRRFDLLGWHSQVIHETGLEEIETEDALFLFQCAGGILFDGYFTAFDEEDGDPGGLGGPADDRRDFGWLRRVWRRTATAHPGARVLGKLFSLGPRLPAFLEEFSDARVIYVVRDPLKTLPSTMSLLTGLLDKRFGFWGMPEATRRRFLERIYQGLVGLYHGFCADWRSGRIPRERVFVCPYDRLIHDFDGIAAELTSFLGIQPDAALLGEISRVAQTQRTRVSLHHYDLARFGLDEGRIREDCAPVYESLLSGGESDSDSGR